MSEGAESDTGTGRQRWIGLVQIGSVIAVAVLAIYFMRMPRTADLGDVAATSGGDAARVEVVRPTAGQRTPMVAATGTVSLHGHTQLSAQVAGRVIWVSPNLRSGGEFKAGEPLLRIDPEDFELAVRRAEARVEEQRARVRRYELKEQKDRAEYARAHPGAAIPAFVSREPQVARHTARMEMRQAELESARLALARTTYSLPFDGRIAATQATIGGLVGPGTPFGRAYSRDALEVQASVSLDDLARLDPAVGRSAQVRVGARSLKAEVERVSAGVQPTSRMASLFLRFSEEVPWADVPGPGVFVQALVAGEPLDDTFVLPDAAERPEGGVWVVDGGVLRSASPRSLGQDPTGWIVAAFDAGDGIVVGPVPGAAEGVEVEMTLAGRDTP